MIKMIRDIENYQVRIADDSIEILRKENKGTESIHFDIDESREDILTGLVMNWGCIKQSVTDVILGCIKTHR